MYIEELKYSIRNLTKGFKDDAEKGVVAFNGHLDVRPPYQREFIYSDEKQKKVIDTIIKGYPLNVFYWCRTGNDQYELMDGQQRTVSVCEYVDGSFSVDNKYFYNLPSDQKKKILDYPLLLYVCDGTDSEKLDWFRIINIAGEQLTDQELRNAVYAGSWNHILVVFQFKRPFEFASVICENNRKQSAEHFSTKTMLEIIKYLFYRICCSVRH